MQWWACLLVALSTGCAGGRHMNAVFEPLDQQQQQHQEHQRSSAERDLADLHIEYIKHEILRKLKLKKEPDVRVKLADLPRPLIDNEILKLARPQAQHYDLEEDLGRTTQQILFPYKDNSGCPKRSLKPSACLPFNMSMAMLPDDVYSAYLWIYKLPDSLDHHNQTFVVSEVAHWDSNRSFQKTKPVAIHETSVKEGWMKIDVLWAVKRSLEYEEATRTWTVTCKTCGKEIDVAPIALRGARKPFLIMNFHGNNRQLVRKKRYAAKCTKGYSECCRERLYIDFKEIGWDWIIYPAGYDAGYCRGACSPTSAFTQSGSFHNSVLLKFAQMGSKNVDIKLCCVATQYDDIQLLYMNSNSTLISKKLSNMVVDSCGCNYRGT